jgi:hypothetical protein
LEYFNDGNDLEYTYTFPQNAPEEIRDLNKIHFFQLRFKYESGINPNADDLHVFYEWNYYVNPVGDEIPTTIELISEEEAEEAVAKAAEELGIDVKIADEMEVETDKNVSADFSDLAQRATGAISFKAEVAKEGDAIVVPRRPTFFIGPVSLGGENLPSVASAADVKRLFGVYKIFADKSKIDLLAEYGDALFDISEDGSITLKAVIVIIDDAAPSNDSRVKRAGDKYGVRLSDDGERLYIYDGDPDKVAFDPIASMLKETSSGGGGGGCDAGTGIFGLLALAGMGLFMRRGR